jgi:toxin ParE1/3/4
MRYRISEEAKRELDDIFAYWAQRASPEIADHLIDSIVDRFWLLGANPNAGRRCDDLGAGLRCFPAGKYLIYYRAGRNRTDILHIFHGARNQRQAFKRAKKNASES